MCSEEIIFLSDLRMKAYPRFAKPTLTRLVPQPKDTDVIFVVRVQQFFDLQIKTCLRFLANKLEWFCFADLETKYSVKQCNIMNMWTFLTLQNHELLVLVLRSQNSMYPESWIPKCELCTQEYEKSRGIIRNLLTADSKVHHSISS